MLRPTAAESVGKVKRQLCSLLRPSLPPPSLPIFCEFLAHFLPEIAHYGRHRRRRRRSRRRIVLSERVCVNGLGETKDLLSLNRTRLLSVDTDPLRVSDGCSFFVDRCKLPQDLRILLHSKMLLIYIMR